MNDQISRSALIAELESYKVAAGDVVIRVIVDRIIDIVKAQEARLEKKPLGDIGYTKTKTETDMPEYHGITWVPDVGYSRELANTMTLLFNEGYRPYSWEFEPASETNLRTVHFKMRRG